MFFKKCLLPVFFLFALAGCLGLANNLFRNLTTAIQISSASALATLTDNTFERTGTSRNLPVGSILLTNTYRSVLEQFRSHLMKMATRHSALVKPCN